METSKRPGGITGEDCAPTDASASNKRAKRGDEDAETKETLSPEAPDESKQQEKEGHSSSAEKPKAAGKPEADVEDEGKAAAVEKEEGETKDKSIESSKASAAYTALMMEEDLQYDSGFTTFPEKLMTLLDSGKVKDRMWWLPDGDGFAFKPENFAETVLAQHFQGTKLESFTRKLNRWGFRRVAGQTLPSGTYAYFHRSFRRGKPEQVKEMSGSKNKQANALRGQRLQQQLQLAAAREEEAASSKQAAYAQQHISQQARAVTGGDMFFPGGSAGDSTGADPRLEYYLMQQRNQQDRVNELAVLEQQRLASLDPEIQMRLLRGGSAYPGFPPGMSSNLLGQQMSFNQRFDPSSNAATAALVNERMSSMPGVPWTQMQQQQMMMQQQQQQQQHQQMQQQQQNKDGGSNDDQGAFPTQIVEAGDTTGKEKSVSSAAAETDPQMFQPYPTQQQQQREEERRGKAPS